MTLKATCPDCDKRYRIPHAEKQWHCKICKAVLVLNEESVEIADQEDAHIRCPECDADNLQGANFCEECGAALGADQEMATARAMRDEEDSKQQMRAAMNTIRRFKLALKALLALNFIRMIRALLQVASALSPMGASMSEASINLASAGFSVVLLLILLHQLARNPFPAALVLASVETLILIITLIIWDLTPVEMAIVGGISAIFPLFYWYVTFRAATLTRLAKENPDFFLSKQLSKPGKTKGRKRPSSRTKPGPTAREASQSRRRADAKPPYIAIGIVSAAVLGVLVFALTNTPDSPEKTMDQIAQAWNERDLQSLADYVEDGNQEKWIQSLELLADKYNWGDDWPQIDEYAFDVRDTKVHAELNTEAGVVPFRLRWSKDAGWILYQMSFKDVKTWKE